MGTTMTPRRAWALQDVPGKGKGLIATEDIAAGTRILCEEPIVTLPSRAPINEQLLSHMRQQVGDLSKTKRKAFLKLHNIHPYSSDDERYLGIFRTNALPIEDGNAGGGIFLNACRINHACDHNSQKDWNNNIRRYTIHALRDIPKDDEITIYYLAYNEGREARIKDLQARLAFTCHCRLCSLPDGESRMSDRRLERLLVLDKLIEQGGIQATLADPLKKLRLVDEEVRLFNEQGPGDCGLARAFFDAAQITIMVSDYARGRIFAQRAVARWRTQGGNDCTDMIRYGTVADDPTTFPMHGLSMQWRTKVDEVPTDLGAEEFEDWLWRRDPHRKLQQPSHALGQLTNLRHRAIFPGFLDLPEESYFDKDYYETSTSQPRRHWCFLAEIADFAQFLRLQMHVVDVDGKRSPLFFYTDDRGSELATAKIRPGYTVAILYAEQHAFKFDEPGIRHEDPSLLKIFPVPLQTLLEISDQVQEYSRIVDDFKTCHGCGKMSASLYKCTRCSFFWYCDQACQAIAWKEKGHKESCKLLKDPDLSGMFKLSWHEFDGHIRFPLETGDV